MPGGLDEAPDEREGRVTDLALRNIVARPVDSEIVAARAPWSDGRSRGARQ
jgi:hypothetical protein